MFRIGSFASSQAPGAEGLSPLVWYLALGCFRAAEQWLRV